MPPADADDTAGGAYGFVTVGTTSFDGMVASVFSQGVAEAIRSMGIVRLVVQLGRGALPRELEAAVTDATQRLASNKDNGAIHAQLHGINYHVYRYKAAIAPDIAGAAFVVSHAGAGSIFETLRAQKPLVVVINTALADNHQVELAQAMSSRRHLAYCEPEGLAETLRGLGKRLLQKGTFDPLPPLDKSGFLSALDGVVGFR